MLPSLRLRQLSIYCMLLLCYFICTGTIHAQNKDTWKIQAISTEQGLSNRFVNDIQQDGRGYTWIASNFGINRYDGHHFDILTRESHHLQSNISNELILDHNGQMWIIQQDAPGHVLLYIDVLDPISLTVQPLEEYIEGPLPFASGDFENIVTDSSHHLYITTKQNEVYRLDQHQLIHLADIPPDDRVVRFGVCDEFLVTIAHLADSVDIWDKNGKWLSRLPSPYTQEMINDSIFWRPIGQVAPNKILVLAFGTFDTPRFYALLDTSGFSPIQPIRSRTINITMEYFDTYGKKLWMEEGGQKFTIDPVSGQLDYQDITKPNVYNFSPVYADQLGLVWFNSENGIYVLSKRHKYFDAYLTDFPEAVSCRGFAEDDQGRIYVCRNDSTLIFNPSSRTFSASSAFVPPFALSATTDKHGHIWFSREGIHINRYSIAKQRFDTYTFNSKQNYFATWCGLQIHSGELLLGTTEGLWIKNPTDDTDPIQFSKLNGYPLDKSTIYHMLDTDEGIWLCTDNGLFLADMDKGIIEHVNEKSAQLPNNNLLFLHKGSDNIYWIASRGGGLIRWDRVKKTFHPYTVSEGLSHNVIYAIYEDDYGFLWMPSDFGLMRFEKATGICRTFLRSEGIPHEEFNRASHFMDSKGNLYFGGLNGFITFHPKDLLGVEALMLPVRLTRFEAINEKTGETSDLTYAATQSKEIRLSSNVSSFIIHYSILDYDDPGFQCQS